MRVRRFLGDPSILNRVELAELQDVFWQSLRVEGSLEAKLADLVTHEQATQEELAIAETQDAPSLLKMTAELRWKCSYYKTKDEAMEADCPGKKMVDHGIADPWRKQRIEELRAEVAAVRREREETETALANACAQTQAQRKTLAQKTSEFVEHRGDITRDIGQWMARKEEANRYGSAWHDLDAIESSRDARQKEIDDSSATQRTVRARFERQKADLSSYYEAVLKHTISPNAEGRIEIDGDGIRPWTSDAVADSGTTLRGYADVLSFDLACLAASVGGVGNLPRFWVHDSPRQADSEEQLYRSIFRFISELEKACPTGRSPSFQYILTTTSAPPKELNCSPYVRIRLHARTDNGKLLRRSFGMKRVAV